jgi:CDP-glucose 4,6-dehydratase
MLCQQLISNPEIYSSAWNFGPNEEDVKSVSVIVDIMMKSWGDKAHWQQDNVNYPHEASYLKLDCNKAKNILQWRPTWSLDLALDETVKWYKAYFNNEDMNKFTLNQIKKYTSDEPLP